ncbi:MAG: pyrimidine 5'-nucleotidase [Caulobacteraceae bacterium]|nr:pyrimidine 5'-nucleotidase [Caulobacteraceae bacterium]
MTAADLRHVDTWLFDLDNTLYPPDTGFRTAIEAAITDYTERLTGLPRAEAYALQKRYLAEHGLTLRGLMIHHGVDPDEFHGHLADLPLEFLARDASLIGALGRLPGRRLIFTNADAGHAGRVMARLGLDHLFDDVFHIGAADFIPKPDPAAFERLSAAHGVDPESTCFFEDLAGNLEPAAALGMTTVLVGEAAKRPAPAHVHHLAPDLAAFLSAARVKEPALT